MSKSLLLLLQKTVNMKYNVHVLSRSKSELHSDIKLVFFLLWPLEWLSVCVFSPQAVNWWVPQIMFSVTTSTSAPVSAHEWCHTTQHNHKYSLTRVTSADVSSLQFTAPEPASTFLLLTTFFACCIWNLLHVVTWNWRVVFTRCSLEIGVYGVWKILFQPGPYICWLSYTIGEKLNLDSYSLRFWIDSLLPKMYCQ